VLTTSREAACVDFYTRVLGMQLEAFGPLQRKALKFGPEDQPACARVRAQGAPVLAGPFIASVPLAEVISRLGRESWPSKGR
jgi:catechol 2,3-dioxygenase-like lactoylglutathione lyase family enzyme